MDPIFENKGVLAVFQGHSHKNDYKHLTGIHYATLVAMVEGTGEENSGYAMADESRAHLSVAYQCDQ